MLNILQYMNVESLHLENFKSIREIKLGFSDLNVFVGANAAGKSNIFKSFQFLQNIRNEGLSDAIQLQGGVEYLRNKSINNDKNLKIEIKICPDKKYKVSEKNIKNKKEKVLKRKYLLSLKFNKNNYSVIKDEYKRKIKIKNGGDEEARIEQTGSGRVLATEYPKSEAELFPSKKVDRNSSKDMYVGTTDYSQYVNPSSKVNMPEFGKIFDINTRKIKKTKTPKGRSSLNSDAANLVFSINRKIDSEYKKEKLVNLVSDTLPFISDTSVSTMPDQSLFLEILEEFEPGEDQYIPAEMLSDGTLRVLALIYLLYFSDHENIFIEEPGRNLHPSLIANLMLKVKDAAENTDKQIFLTTHNVEVVKYAPLESIRLVSRDDDGFTQVEQPAENERVQRFLDEGVRMDDMYTENLLGE